MAVQLTPEHEEIVERAIAKGRYLSAKEVLDAALQFLEEDELVREFRLKRLQHEIDKGLDQIERGQIRSFDPLEMKNRVKKRLRQKEAKKSNAVPA